MLDFYPLCVFKCTSVCHLEKRHIQIICTCSTFLCCILSKVILICIPEKKHRCIRYIYLTFLQYESSNDSSNHYHNCRHSCIVYICLTFKKNHQIDDLMSPNKNYGRERRPWKEWIKGKAKNAGRAWMAERAYIYSK